MINQITREHYSKYEGLSKKINQTSLNNIARDITRETHGIANLKFLFSRDQNLNNIPLKFWDALAGARTDVMTKQIVWFGADINFPAGLSLAERVCLIKHIVIYKIIKAKPDFGDQTLL